MSDNTFALNEARNMLDKTTREWESTLRDMQGAQLAMNGLDEGDNEGAAAMLLVGIMALADQARGASERIGLSCRMLADAIDRGLDGKALIDVNTETGDVRKIVDFDGQTD